MNILLYSHTFLPTIGGREMVIYQLGKALIDLGHSVRVVGPQGFLSARKQRYSMQVCRYPRISSGRPLEDRTEQRLLEAQMLPQLAFDIAIRGADVIHAHTLYPSGYVASMLKVRYWKRPLVLTPHGVDINTAVDRNYGMRLNPELRRKIDIAMTRADAVTAISEGVYGELIKAGVNPEKVRKIGNGIDLERFQGPPSSDVRERLGLPGDARLILTVGNYTSLKGHEDLIEAFPAIRAREPRAHLVIAGANTEHLRAFADALGVGRHVTMTGSIPMPNLVGQDLERGDFLADLYRASDVYVSASNREGGEGLSLALLDAMAARLPIVATNIVGNRDVIEHGVNGFLVALGDREAMVQAIASVVTNPGLRNSMGDKSLICSQKYSWESIARRYEGLYSSILGQDRSMSDRWV